MPPTNNNHNIQYHLEQLKHQIRATERACHRKPNSVTLLAVSKTRSSEAIKTAYLAGQTQFGENYLQEALIKINQLTDYAIQWHYIGHIQSNKTRAIANHFSWVHSVCRWSDAERLNRQRPIHLPSLNVCIEVNLEKEKNKSGVFIEDVQSLAEKIATLPRLTLRGLMAIPQPRVNFSDQQIPFEQLRELLHSLIDKGLALDTLSMGMSMDFKAAIAAGATIVRIGTIIFGPREKKC